MSVKGDDFVDSVAGAVEMNVTNEHETHEPASGKDTHDNLLKLW